MTALGTTGSASEWDAVINAKRPLRRHIERRAYVPEQTLKDEGVLWRSRRLFGLLVGCPPGSYSVKADFAAMTVTLSTPSGIDVPGSKQRERCRVL